MPIDLTKTLPYEQAQTSKRFLTDGIIWIEAFVNNPKFVSEILEWIKKDQLTDEGIDGLGEVIGYYSQTTARLNPSKAFNTPYTLNDTGAFYRSLFIQVLADEIVIDGDTSDFDDQAWFREEIVALTEENLQRLIDAYKEKVIDYARKILVGR